MDGGNMLLAILVGAMLAAPILIEQTLSEADFDGATLNGRAVLVAGGRIEIARARPPGGDAAAASWQRPTHLAESAPSR